MEVLIRVNRRSYTKTSHKRESCEKCGRSRECHRKNSRLVELTICSVRSSTKTLRSSLLSGKGIFSLRGTQPRSMKDNMGWNWCMVWFFTRHHEVVNEDVSARRAGPFFFFLHGWHACLWIFNSQENNPQRSQCERPLPAFVLARYCTMDCLIDVTVTSI